MKDFLKNYLIILVIIEAFFFFGGGLLFSLEGGYYRAGAVWALPVAAVLTAFVRQEEKLEALKKRLDALEKERQE